jgi:menaquinone-dependent protoporphyrinogen oxidase
MTSRFLITYVTCTGYTRGVAEAIGKTLAQSGAEVDILPMAEVRDLSPYRAVVAGSPI